MEGPPTKPDWNRLFETASSQEGYRAWFGAVPTTNPRHTLNDCARAGLSPELSRQAAQQALRRGLVTKAELADVEKALQPFGGLAAPRRARTPRPRPRRSTSTDR